MLRLILRNYYKKLKDYIRIKTLPVHLTGSALAVILVGNMFEQNIL